MISVRGRSGCCCWLDLDVPYRGVDDTDDGSHALWVFAWFDVAVAVAVVVVAFDGADMMIEEKRQWAGKAGSSYLGETNSTTKHTAYIRRRRPLILFLTPPVDSMPQCSFRTELHRSLSRAGKV